MQFQNIKRIGALLVAFLLSHEILFSQVILTQPSGMETYVIRKESVMDPASIASLTNAEKARSISYVDGFGRPIQSIVAAGSPNGKDIVSFARYDLYGRQPKQYLPYEAATSTGAYTAMSAVEGDQLNFYLPGTAAAKKIAGDSYPYSESSFEPSPLGRVLTMGGVGDGFQLGQHWKTLSYRNNVSGDNVHKWVLGTNATSTTNYIADELTVSEVADENNLTSNTNFTSKIFKDKLGRVILKRQPGNLDTYYVYDNIGNIVFIVPPKAIAKMNALSYNTSLTPHLIYQFWYDVKNRIIRKKVPGATEVYMVYDPLDRIVLTQDGNMRNSNGTKWAYVKYDNANRVIIQGVYTHGSVLDQPNMQAYVNNVTLNPCYDVGSTTYYEERAATASGYSNHCFPINDTEERGYNYFDDYDFDFDGNPDYSKEDQGLTGEAMATGLTYGLATGSKRKILGSGTPGTWLVDISFYDKYYHVIQVRSNNQQKTDVTDHVTNVINFSGQALEAKQVKTINNPSNRNYTRVLEIKTRYEYDDMGRLLKIKQTNPDVAEVTVAKYEYNALGQLVDKKLHSIDNGATYLQSVDMRYNIRGQLLSINNSAKNVNTNNNDETNDVFGMEILYDKLDTDLGNTQNYVGMISAIKWSAVSPATNTAERSFKYGYDNLYRLTAATYQEKTGSAWTQNQGDFNEIFSYDENGNIATMERWARFVGSGSKTKIDQLTYSYKSSDLENQLKDITDQVTTYTTGYGYRNFTNTGNTDPYSYDDNGNLTGDLKKGTTISYNEMSKPTLIQISSTKKVEYIYDAAGTRLRKIVTDNSNVKTIDYMGGVVTENEILSYYSMAEGRVRNDGDNLGYDIVPVMEYFISDHQGNTRVSFERDANTGLAKLSQENSYYAFGMQMAGSYMPTNANKKLYNAGSEWQDDIEGLADYYSTFFREYDPVIGRFNGVDPKSEKFESWSTYHYSYNNPVNFNDPMGDYATYTAHSSPMRDLVERVMQSQGWGGGWLNDDEGSGGGGGGGGGGDSRFSNARDLFEYIQVMGTNSVNTTYGGMSADAWGVNDMSISEVSSAWSYLGELGVTAGYGKRDRSSRNSDADARKAKGSISAQIWYYVLKTNDGPHSLVYDPYTQMMYEVNNPTVNGQVADGLTNWLVGGAKAQGYAYNMGTKEGAANFWQFNERGTLLLSPVLVLYPGAATAYFKSNVGKQFDYNIGTSNCKHYVMIGLAFYGGSYIPPKTYANPLPYFWHTLPTQYWKQGMLSGPKSVYRAIFNYFF